MPMTSFFPFTVLAAAAVLVLFIAHVPDISAHSSTMSSHELGDRYTTRIWANTTVVTFGRRRFSWTIEGKCMNAMGNARDRAHFLETRHSVASPIENVLHKVLAQPDRRPPLFGSELGRLCFVREVGRAVIMGTRVGRNFLFVGLHCRWGYGKAMLPTDLRQGVNQSPAWISEAVVAIVDVDVHAPDSSNVTVEKSQTKSVHGVDGNELCQALLAC
ncbi:hypothetical protein DFH07DRAFT_779714 [Mycena maculata]|uniref:Uncharacterized protein n=1 Tax=Mycena maculata TaxID=230809 RepID=A0AAD7I8G0_9AGAR|nr:hypothetical protein DFH07DRAFT_779714 [Mycena maculata]